MSAIVNCMKLTDTLIFFFLESHDSQTYSSEIESAVVATMFVTFGCCPVRNLLGNLFLFF